MSAKDEPSNAPVPGPLGPWRLLRELDGGGMGTVWLAERADGAFRMNAAVKLIKWDDAAPAAIQRFVRERQILADLAHGNICRLLDGGTTPDGQPYLVMEYIDGQHIDQFCRGRKLSSREILHLIIPICNALSAAHERGIVHRDLKPGNIIVTAAGEPKLVDFGIARACDTVDDGVTQTGHVVMTSAYASPEQWRDQNVGPESDIFALGIMLFELLSGWLPQKPGLLGVAPPPAVKAALGDELYRLVIRAVQENPRDRYPGAADLARALGDYLGVAAGGAALAHAPRIFISCRGDVAEDVELGLSFYRELVAAGATPFLAPKNVPESADWVRAVTAALRDSDVFLLLLSPKAAVSEMVAAELELACRVRETSPGKPQIVPVRVRFPETGSYPMRDQLEALEHVVWQQPRDTAAVVATLLGNLAGKAPNPRQATTGPPDLPRGTAGAELPGDIVGPDSPYYVARPGIEDRCLREVLAPGALIRIKGPRQMGKTSLMKRLLSHARGAGARTVAVDLRLADRAILGDLDRFLRWLCAVSSRQLKIRARPTDDLWDDMFGAKDNCSAFFEDHLLSAGGSLVLAIDHLDQVFERAAIADEFLSLLRAWHEMGKSQEPWHALRMILVHATEIYVPMNINHSPFNVGLSVALSEWEAGAVEDLAGRHGLAMKRSDIDQLMSLLGGHPHLVRLALYHMAEGGMSLGDVMAKAGTDQGLFADHLKHLLWQLETLPELGEAAGRVMAAGEPVVLSTELAFKLASLGLVRLEGNSVCSARELYKQYLAERLRVQA